jgi:hypothetical protein
VSWPKTRLRTYADGITPVNANDLNEFQDAVIGLFSPPPLNIASCSGWGSGTPNQVYVALANGAGLWIVPIPVNKLDRINGITLSMFGNGVTDVTAQLEVWSKANFPTLLANVVMNNTPAAWTDYHADVGAPHTIADGEVLTLTYGATNGAGLQAGNIQLFRDRASV